MIRAALALLLLLVCLFGHVRETMAQETAAPADPLTLAEVLAVLAATHPQLEAARQRQRAAEGDAMAARGGFDPVLRARVVHEGLMTYLADNSQAWELQTDGTYVRCTPGAEEARMNFSISGRCARTTVIHRTTRRSTARAPRPPSVQRAGSGLRAMPWPRARRRRDSS